MDKNNTNEYLRYDFLEFILFVLLGSSSGIFGMVPTIILAYLVNYKKIYDLIISFLIGTLLFFFIWVKIPNALIYFIYNTIIGIIAFMMAYIINKNKQNG